jgi:hypothetical protein
MAVIKSFTKTIALHNQVPIDHIKIDQMKIDSIKIPPINVNIDARVLYRPFYLKKGPASKASVKKQSKKPIAKNPKCLLATLTQRR